MDSMTLREAAQRTSRSVTTLRRYIRSGRLHAELRDGRFGPEYFVSDRDLASAGLDDEPAGNGTRAPALERAELAPRVPASDDRVPLVLYQELQMKHEQLLVQYGMMRAGGLQALELRDAREARSRELERARETADEKRRASAREAQDLRRQLREAELELEGRAVEIAALQEKVRALEMLSRNSVTNETIDRQFHAVMEQVRRVDRLRDTASDSTPDRTDDRTDEPWGPVEVPQTPPQDH